MLRAIRGGEANALVEGDAGPRRFTLQGLDAEQNRFRGEMLAQVSDAVIVVDTEDRVTFLNAAAERQYGVRAGEVLGCTLAEIFTPHWPSPEIEAGMRTALSERGAWRGELIHRKSDGSELHVETSATALHAPDGAGSGYVASIRDITERHQAEAALRRNTALFAQIIEQAPGGVYVVDAQFRLQHVNAEALPAFASVQPLIGRDFDGVMEILWGPEIGPQCASIFRHTLATGERYVSPRFSEQRHDIGVEQAFEWETRRITLPDGQHGVVCYFQDVSARERAEAALRASEDRLRLAVEVSGLGVLSIDYAADTSTPDATAAALFGLEPGVAVPRSQVHARFHPDDGDEIGLRMRQCLDPTGDGCFAMEHRVVHLDGTTKWLSVQKQVVFGEAGGVLRPVSGVLAAVDITPRKRAEAARLESEEHYRALAVASSEIAYRMSADWSTMLPLDGRQLVASSDQSLADWAWLDQNVPSDEHPRVRQAISEAIARKALFELEHRVWRPDASVGWTFSRAVPILDENQKVTAWFGAAGDITARKAAEEALHESEVKVRAQFTELQHVYDHAPVGLATFDLELRYLRINERFAEINGYSVAEHLGRTVREILPTHADDFAELAASILASGRAVENVQFVGETRAQPGVTRFWSASWYPVRGERGEIIGFDAVVEDITERRRAEDTLRESEHFLQRVTQVTPGVISVFDVELGRSIFVSDAVASIIGYGPKEIAAMGSDAATLMHPDDQPRFAQHLERVRALGDEESADFDHRMRTKSGEWRWFQSRDAVFARDDAGKVVQFVSAAFDVTERKLAEAALAERTALLNGVLEGTTDVIFVKDLNGRIVLVNAAFAAAAKSTPEQLVGKTDEYWFPPDVAAAVRQQDEAVIAGGLPMQFEETIPVAGEARVFLTLKAPMRDGSSRVVGILGIGRDISDRKQAETELRRSEARFRAAITAVSDIVWTNDAEGQMAGEQTAWENFTGQDRESYQGYGWSRAVHPDDAQPTIDAWNEAVAGKQLFAFEHRVRRSDGQWRLCSIRAVPILDHRGEIGEWVGVHTDITERIRVEEIVRNSEARLSGILRQSPAGILQTDAAGCLTMVNLRFCQMLGFDNAELLGVSIMEITHSSSRTPTAAAFGGLAAGGPDIQIEKAYCRKDGSVLHAQSNVAALRSPAGEFLGIIAVVLDISERLRTEVELRRLAAELSEADRRKDVFLATLAHELRNPLAPIRNGLQLMKLAKNNGEAVERARAMMDRQLSQMVRLVDDLLDVSRISQGKVELRKERLDLKAVIDAALETSRPAIEQSGHELAVVVPDEPIFVDGDPTRLAQVVSNLLNNSAKYTHRGGHVRLSVGREGGTAVVSIKDNGIGIPPTMLDKVFVMFTQVDRTLEKTTGGLGVGLSLVKGLLEMHGGTIEARSDGEGMGSEFVVRLPVVMNVVAEPERPHGRTNEFTPSARRRILVVDDNVDSADSLSQLLEMLGNEVHTANDGEAGIALAAKLRPDLVMMDIGMPTLNGYEAARRMREQPWGLSIVLVALTGWGHDDDREASKMAGFDHHVVKPVGMSVLTKLLADTRTTMA